MRFRYLHVPFYYGMSVLFIGILLKIQRWSVNSEYVIIGGTLLVGTFFILAVLEILTSAAARRISKLIWAAVQAGVPIAAVFILPKLFAPFALLITGSVYLSGGRRLFVPSKRDFERITFDSIKKDEA